LDERAALWKAAELVTFAAIASAMLAGCSSSSVVSSKSAFHSVPRVALSANHRVAPSQKRPLKFASYGLASFYEESGRTADGEEFDPQALTAAHPTLPFGTRLRVTNVSTGRSVIVRINDRGPFIPGRIVDVSYSAAKTLGIVGRGTAEVKLDVVQ
jgi:rare lipoprotein A